ncbi:aquaporin [Mycoplasma elephantis]|uniref:aquaporin n=1 Tax=Mycoplasma elephantis TaxID=114882 RepID=UPI0005690683|nr:aquaporin [Mycoplasma elephantis]
MFNYFKMKDRSYAKEPNSWINWFKHLSAEFFGTIWISFGLAGLSILINNKSVESFMIHNLIVAFYAGFIVVGIALLVFLRWSCDLNPAVTLYRMINGLNTCIYGLAKIAIQMIAGILTGLIIYWIGKNTNNNDAANLSISALAVSNKDFIESNSIAAGGAWIFFGEMVMTSILLFPIFSPNLKDKTRDILIMFIISLSVLFGLLLGSAAINPARGLAQQVPDLFFGLKNGSCAFKYVKDIQDAKIDLIVATLAMLFGSSLSAVFYALVQGILENYINPFVTKIIAYKNFKIDQLK